MTPTDLAQTHAAAFTATRPWSAAEFASLLERKTTRLIGSPQSFILASHVVDEVEILTLATHPKAVRTGLAKANMQALLSQAAKDGAERVFLEVASDNQAALALYAGFGFVQVASRTAYYQRENAPAADALILEKQLT